MKPFRDNITKRC